MPTELARLTTVKNMVMEHLLVSPTYGTYSANGNYSENYILDEIRKANDDVVFYICSNPKHSRRGDFITTQASNTITTSGTKLPTSIGGWNNIKIVRSDTKEVVGKKASFEWIDTLINQVSALGLSPDDWQGYFDIVDDRLYFTGNTAGVSFCNPVPATGALTAPIEYETAIRDLALCRAYMKHNDNPEASSFYRSMAFNILQSIREDRSDIPSLDKEKNN